MMSSNEPLITIGVPTYDRMDSLFKCIEHILSQSYSNIELIVSDNRSSSSDLIKKRVLERFNDTRLNFISQKENIGATANFSYVLNSASGNYFMWCGDDDFLSPTYVWSVVNFLERNLDYVSCCGAPYSILPNGDMRKVIGSEGNFEHDNAFVRVCDTYKATSGRLISIYGLTRIDNLKKIEILGRFAEDRYNLAALAYQGKIKMLEDVKFARCPGISSGGDKEFHEKINKNLGFNTKSMFITRFEMAMNAAKDILIQDRVYTVSYLYRTVLMFGVFICSILDTCLKFYFNPFKKSFNLKRLNIKKKFRQIASKLLKKKSNITNEHMCNLELKNKIAIWGWWQGRNLGDNWIKKINKSIFPNAHFIDTETDKINDYGFVVIGGGGLFIHGVIEPWRQKIKSHYGAIGIGAEFKHLDYKARELASNADFFYVRDNYSLEAMNVLDAERSYDITFYEPLERKEKTFSNTKCLFSWRNDLDGLRASHVNFENYFPRPVDENLWLMCLKSHFTDIISDDFTTDSDDITRLLVDVDLIVSSRFHGIVAAIQMGIPCIAIDVCPKIRTIMEDCGLSEYCILPNKVDKLDELIRKAVKDAEIIREKQYNYTENASNVMKLHVENLKNTISNLGFEL